MAKTDLVPAYYDGSDRSKPPVFVKSREEIKSQRRAGLLNGGYQENGDVFILYRAQKPEKVLADIERWITRQSGYAGPLVLQMI